MVDEQGVISIVEPEKIVPAVETPISLTDLEQAREEAAVRADELRRQGNAALAESENADKVVADFDVHIAAAKAKSPVQVDDLEEGANGVG